MTLSKILKKVSLVITIAGITFVVFKIVYSISTLGNDVQPSTTMVVEYKQLFPQRYRDSLKNIWNYNSKNRSQISLFEIELQKKFDLTVYKLPTSSYFLIKNVSVIPTKDIGTSVILGVREIVNEGMLFEVTYGMKKPQDANSMYFKYNGRDLKTVIKNDSVFSFSVDFQYFSIIYNNSTNVDIDGATHKNIGRIPMDVMILRRNGSFYLLLLTQDNDSENLAPDLLYKLISN